nr:hypothetical protein [Tanacetum cinerariifolium]
MTMINKKKYITDVRVMNYPLQAIPNDIYNSVDACKTAQEMWERIKAKEGESLEFVYERLTKLVNIMDRNNVRLIPVSINTCNSISCNPSGVNMLPWFFTTKQEIKFHMISSHDNIVIEPNYDAKAFSEVNASHKVHEQENHGKCKNIIHTSDDDQIDSSIIFDDPYVENNSDTSEHDSNAHDQYHDIQILAYNVQREAKSKTIKQ